MKGSRIWMVLAALVVSRVFGAGGLFIVDGVPQRHAGLASQAYVDGHVPEMSVAASNATRLIQIDAQAWVTVAGGTATLWQVAVTTQLVCAGAGTLAVNGLYAGSVAGGYFENTTNADMTVIGEEDSWFVYDRGGGGWLYHCFGSEFPVGGVWLDDFGAAPVPTFSWGEIVSTNAYPLARIEDLGAYCTVAQLAAASNALVQAMVELAATNDPCTFPVLVLPLGGQWTDFELKASTNNFTSLCYYIMSSGTNAYTSDTNVWVYFTDDYAADVRQWRRSALSTAIGSQVVEPAKSEVEYVVVLPSHAGAVDWRQWMSQKNDKLVWSFVRYDGIGLEMNATGTKTHWSPVVPVEWRTARIAP